MSGFTRPQAVSNVEQNTLKGRLTKLIGGEFGKNVLTLMTGTALSQAVPLLLSPLITRLFSPDDFTALEIYTMYLNILVVVVTGKYEYAIMQPSHREDARHVLALSTRISLVSSAVLLIVAVFAGPMVGEYYGLPTLGAWLWTLPITLLAFATFNSVNFWFSRQKNYRVAATAKVWNSASSEPVKLGFGLAGLSSFGLIIPTVFGNVASAIYSVFHFLKDEPLGFRNIDRERLKKVAREYRDYPLFTIWGSLFSRMAQWAHIGLFTQYYGIVAVGYMALCRRVFMTPLNIVAASFGQVFYQKISEVTDDKELYRIYMAALKKFMAFALACLVVVLLLPQRTMGVVFGSEWERAIEFLKILSFWYVFNFVTSSLSYTFYRIGAQRLTAFIDAVHFALIVGCIHVSYKAGLDELEALKALVVCKVLLLLSIIAITLVILKRNASKALVK